VPNISNSRWNTRYVHVYDTQNHMLLGAEEIRYYEQLPGHAK